MSFEEAVCKLAADIAAASPALVMKAVEALASSRRACSAADALIHLFLGTFYLFYAAMLFDVVAARVCVGHCAARSLVYEITGYIFIASLVLSPPAVALFFLRAAGSCASELAEGLIMKDLGERHSGVSERLQSPLLSAAGCLFSGGFWLAFIWGILQLCGLFPEIADLLLDANCVCIWSCFALIYIRAGMALRRMNPRPNDIIVAEADHAASPSQDFELGAAR